ncbi:MAG TPA: phosphatase PAP2 family protein [Polyangiaceae bacterium]|nr:phosphatase PAP2 family protein [Polyangiaceae bacterium]
MVRGRGLGARAAAAAVALSAASLLGPRAARAQDGDEPRRRDVGVTMLGNGLVDVGFVALAAGALLGGTYVIRPNLGDRAPLDGLGRREHVPHLDRAGDFSVGIGLGTGAALAFLTELGDGQRGWGLARGPIVVAEGALAASAFTQLLKNVFGVCRPRDWEPKARHCGVSGEGVDKSERERVDEAHRSFPSGHNAPLAGVAGASMGLYLLPSGRRPEYLPVALTATGFALTTVVLREQAGAHSWVDTGAAFISGGAAGFVTALLHVETSKRAPEGEASGAPPPPAAPAMVTFGGAF